MKSLTRRRFLKSLGALGISLMEFAMLGGCEQEALQAQPRPSSTGLQEARFYERLPRGNVRCGLCFRRCVIPEGARGVCRNRENRGGWLYTLVYGRPCAVHVDPIEKEPVFHMLPGEPILCTATVSCNSRCLFCHNWHISQKSIEEVSSYSLSPHEVVQRASNPTHPVDAICRILSFTYTEPTAFYEYMYDIAKRAKELGFRTICHTNGLVNTEPLLALLEHMDAITVDLKAFTSQFYQETCSTELEPVLETLRTIAQSPCHLEIVNLVIPTLNDDLGVIRRMCLWIAENLGVEVPLHFNRFFPSYKLTNLPPTPIATLERARAIAIEVGLHYVYIGNTPGHKYNSTFCPECQELLIKRSHFSVRGNHLEEGKCPACKHPVPGIWV